MFLILHKSNDSTIMNELNVESGKIMESLTANEAKTQFGDMLLKAQKAPIQINKNGKPVAVVVSMDDYKGIEALKLRLLKSRIIQAKKDIASQETVDGESFFDELEAGQYDSQT